MSQSDAALLGKRLYRKNLRGNVRGTLFHTCMCTSTHIDYTLYPRPRSHETAQCLPGIGLTQWRQLAETVRAYTFGAHKDARMDDFSEIGGAVTNKPSNLWKQIAAHGPDLLRPVRFACKSTTWQLILLVSPAGSKEITFRFTDLNKVITQC